MVFGVQSEWSSTGLRLWAGFAVVVVLVNECVLNESGITVLVIVSVVEESFPSLSSESSNSLEESESE